MKTIHKVVAIVVKNNELLVVKKVGKDIYTGLGGKPKGTETEQEALLREIKEECGCEARLVRKIGDFEDDAVFDPGMRVKLSCYLTDLKGTPRVSDPELEKIIFIGKDYKSKGITLSPSFESQILPRLRKEFLIRW